LNDLYFLIPIYIFVSSSYLFTASKINTFAGVSSFHPSPASKINTTIGKDR
jgi:hypothetical protein